MRSLERAPRRWCSRRGDGYDRRYPTVRMRSCDGLSRRICFDHDGEQLEDDAERGRVAVQVAAL
jgi:hypothetical protein